MFAMVIDRHGGPELLRATELPPPLPGPRELRVRVLASSVNPADLRARAPAPGRLVARSFPLVLGYDFAGVVDAVGSEVRGFALGDEVMGCPDLLGPGAHAEFCTVDARVVARVPAGLEKRVAGAAPLVCLTAYNALVERAAVQPGERVLVHAGAGGVGHVAIQLARWLGAEVFATAGRPESLAFCRELGAQAFDYGAPDLFVRLEQALAPRGVDVVIDSIGGATLAHSARLLAPLGRLVCLVPSDFTGAGPAPFLRSVSLFYEMMGTRLSFAREPERLGRALAVIAGLLADGSLRLHVAEQYPLRELCEAHRRLEAGGFVGKLAIQVA